MKRGGSKNRIARIALFVLSLASALNAAPAPYDPLGVAAAGPVQTIQLEVIDQRREDRRIPLKVYLPAQRTAAPVVLYSHGLGGSRETAAFLGEHWSQRGYVAVFIQHPGSDESIWKDVRPIARMRAMRKAANLANFELRVRDVPAVIDMLARCNADPAHPLSGRIDLTRIGMSGHSFGAVTTQAVSGQTIAAGVAPFTDARIKAALIMSPSAPRGGATADEAFGAVSIPWLIMTGTDDRAPIGGATVSSRLRVYPALPPGSKYELVLDGAEHSAFTERALPFDAKPRNPNHHRAMLALSTAFWDAYLRDDRAARAWLDGAGPASILEPKDRWRRK
jgi:predicted dienelactone hydrolase